MRTQRQPTTPLPADGICKSLGFLEMKKAEGGASTPVFRITSEVLDRAHDRVMGDGAKVENFNRNPVLLWDHESWTPAIGTAKVYRDASGQWLMEPNFDGIGELSKDIAAKVAAGTLRTCSIRFKYLKHAYNDDGGLDVIEWELLEVSITNIPCNPEAERVKSSNQNPKQKNDTPTPPPEEEMLPVLGKADVDTLTAAMAEQLKPVMEQLAALQQSLADMKGMHEKQATPPPEPQPEKSASVTRLFIR